MPATLASNRTSQRAARAAVAGIALLANAVVAAVVLLWSCCGGIDLASNAATPLFWGALSGVAVALLAMPPVSQRVLRGRARWLALAFVLGTLPLWSAAPALVGEIGAWYGVGIAATAVCAVYTVWRLATPPAR